MTTETKTIEVKAYRDEQGFPCCAGDFKTGKVCIFYRIQNFGTNETCVFVEEYNNRGMMASLRRRKDGLGSLIPFKDCPIWKGD